MSTPISSSAGRRPLLDTPSRQVAGAALAIAAAILVLFALAQWQSYERTLARAERDTRNAALLLAEHAARTFDGIEDTLRAVGRLRGDVVRGIYRSQASIHIHLKTLQGGSPILREVGWFDAYGERVATSRQLDPPRISVAEDELFLALRDSRTRDLHVSAPVLAANGAAWEIGVSLRLENLDGSFAGVAAGTIDPEEFAKLYRALDLGPGMSATLLRRDGVVLAHAPDASGVLGRSVAGTALFHEHLARAPSGTYHGGDVFERTAQIASYASIPGSDAGFVISVGVSRAHALAEFWPSLSLHGSAAALVLFMLFIGTRQLVVGLRRRERLQADLARATAAADAARVEAERANCAKSAFLAHMSHELRTPLNAIMGFGQMLELDYPGTLTPGQKEYAGHIVNSGQHLLELVNEVLDLAGVESGRLMLNVESLAAGDVFAAVADIVTPVAAKAGVTLRFERAAEAPLVRADALRLRQSLINLVSNAVKYNERGGAVTVRVRKRSDSRIRFIVSDTGKGIAPERRADLFEPFRRLGAEYTAVEGTGLGLALTKRLVEAMGGSVGFVSELGRGSSFWIDLPADSSPAAPTRADAGRTLPTDAPPIRISA
jgi:signal transduction histidine kinase